jgi:hypothetical protein
MAIRSWGVNAPDADRCCDTHQAKDRQLIEHATDIRIRAERRAGQLLSEMQESGERESGGRRNQMSHAATLNDLGVTRTRSSR